MLANVFKLLGLIVEDLDIACEILLSIVGSKLARGQVSVFTKIELVVADSEKIVVDVLKDGIRKGAVRVGGVAKTSAIVKISCIKDETCISQLGLGGIRALKHTDQHLACLLALSCAASLC